MAEYTKITIHPLGSGEMRVRMGSLELSFRNRHEMALFGARILDLTERVRRRGTRVTVSVGNRGIEFPGRREARLFGVFLISNGE